MFHVEQILCYKKIFPCSCRTREEHLCSTWNIITFRDCKRHNRTYVRFFRITMNVNSAFAHSFHGVIYGIKEKTRIIYAEFCAL